MGIIAIFILLTTSLSIAVLLRGRGRLYTLLAASTIAIYWLQPPLPIRNLDFFLPLITLALSILGWIFTAPPEKRDLRPSLPALGVVFGVTVALAVTRYLGLDGYFLPTRPPRIEMVGIVLVVLGVALAAAYRFSGARLNIMGLILVLITLLVVIKMPLVTEQASALLRWLNGQSSQQATAFDIRWLGFSYVAFRLIHTLRDRQMGRLPDLTLAEYLTFILFFPAITAGPIDRVERFVKNLRDPQAMDTSGWLETGQRLFLGLFKKFVLADTLALIALNDRLAEQVSSAGWMWLVVYAYALQIYLDFSGYTDIAIGMARLVGVRLPENFAAPYTQPNLTQFWNAWHMTLTQWFRAYFFNPFSRALRTSRRPLPAWAMILLSQLSTMVLIGLWHGITWNFVWWGVWHGVGLFIHNRWSDFTRARAAAWAQTPVRQAFLSFSGALLNFHFVAMGWVFFALSSPGLSGQVFLTLAGVR